MSELTDLLLDMRRLLACVDDKLARIEARLGHEASGASSVEVKTSTRGVDITTKAYAGSPITSAGDAAMDEFLRVGREVEKRLMGQA